MSKRSVYGQRIKQLLGRLKKAGGAKPTPPPFERNIERFMFGVLASYSSEQRAATALRKVLEAVVDLNELRVTPVANIVEIIGVDYPQCRPAAEGIVRVLNGLFNRQHDMDLSTIGRGSRKAAEELLDVLDGVHGHAKAYVLRHCVNVHAVPLDAAMYEFLVQADCVPADCSVDDAQKLVASFIRDKDADLFYALFKRHAATHSGRKLSEEREKKGKSPRKSSKERKAATTSKSPTQKKTSAARSARTKVTARTTTSQAKATKRPAKTSKSRATSKKKKAGAGAARRSTKSRSRAAS